MLKQDVYKQINDFAPYNTAEKWDCSGWIVDNSKKSVEKVMLCLTVTDDIVEQAKKSGCDLILSHHPLFFVPLKYKDINMDMQKHSVVSFAIHLLLNNKYNYVVEIILDLIIEIYFLDDINPYEPSSYMIMPQIKKYTKSERDALGSHLFLRDI